MILSRRWAGLLATIGFTLLATTGCMATEPETAPPSAEASPTESSDASGDGPNTATIDGTFLFADGTTVGMLAKPWTTTDVVDGLLFHQLPGAPGGTFAGAVWGDLMAYVPDAAYSAGSADAEAMPADPVAWTVAHADLEILDQREITVDGVTATQIDARAITPTNWLAVEGTEFEWGAEERVVLIPLGGSWLVVRGGVFEPDIAFSDTPAAGDPFDVMLTSVDLAD